MPLCTPSYFTHCVSDITPDILKKLNIKGIILDIDDTLTSHGNPIPNENALKWVNILKKHKIKLILVSNNHKKRVSDFSKKLNIPYIYMGLKPLPFGIKKAIKYLNLPSEEIIVIGDQIFADIMGANFLNLKSILVDPVSKSKKLILKIKRIFEKNIRKKIKNNQELNLDNFKNKSPEA